MRYIYHYSSHYQGDDKNLFYIDGTLNWSYPIDTMDRYKEVKKLISPDNAHRLIIDSLSLLHRKLW